jgi:APA family basic amino acid/polyamine antiporter
MPEVTAGGIGIIIGAGIYVLVGTATAEAGAGVWLSFLIAAAISFLTALSYMELASMYPSAAGEYQYTRQAFPEWLAFSVGWIMISGLVVAAAAISLGFARYLGYFVDVDVRAGALFLLVAVVFIAGAGIRESLRLTMLLSAIQVGGLVFVVAIGASHLGQHDVFQFNGVDGVLSAAALVFFAFIGFDEVITLSEETANPTRTIPRALGLALGISTLLYVAVAVTSVSVLGAEALGASGRPLADVIGHAIGGDGAKVMAGLAVVSTTNTTLLAVTAASRLMYGMASDQSLPAVLARLHPTRQTPLVALVCAAVFAGLFVLVRDLKLVASTTDFAIYLVFLAVNATVIVLRYRKPDHPRAFVVPGKFGRLPFVPIVASLTVLLMMAFLDPVAIGLGLLLAASGLAVFLVFDSGRDRQAENAGL